MIQTDNYNMIFKRKSIRKYKAEGLSPEQLKDIETFLATIDPLYPDIKIELKLVDASEINNLLPIKAPHYLVVSSENKEGHFVNIGYILQKLDLFLSANGIGGCYVGMAKPSKSLDTLLLHPFIIAYAFGMPDEPLHRQNLEEFKRKTLSEISSSSLHSDLLEVARLAPSATNSQPWSFVSTQSEVHIYRIKRNVISAMVYDKMNQIDMGIVLRHMTEYLIHNNFDFTLTNSTDLSVTEQKGCLYLTTLTLTL